MSNPAPAARMLPPHPNLEQQKTQAGELLDALRRGDREARQRFRDFHPDFATISPGEAATPAALHDAQLVIAREYGFASWAKLKHHIESVTSSVGQLELLARAVKVNDLGEATRILTKHEDVRARLNEAMPGGDFDQTMIAYAANRERFDMVDLLLAHGANINQRSYWWAGGFGVLDTCNPTIAGQLIERGARVDVHSASRLGMLDHLDVIVSSDPQMVHARGGDGETPLHFAANIDIARYLVEHGAEIDVRDIDHESTPAQYMIRDRHEVARWLVDRGATADILMAAALGDVDRVRAHLDENPSSIRTSVTSEWFPMSNPRAGGTIYIWTLGSNKMAHSVARDFGHQDVVALLIDRMPDTMRLVLACEAGDERTARELIAREPDLLARTLREDARRLGDMAWAGNTAAALLMLELGWSVDVEQGRATPLHQAAWTGNASLVRELIRRGADVNAREAQFNGTPLGWAMHGAENNGGRGDPVAVVELLRAAGAM